ncbi:hypothetical protein D5S19_02100 [Amycolatopsis panacis]|uniref:RNA polymerase sigma-70 region 2 domain-containing protein n=1 Tax=Amycolatopsis panacis TaxID=2340917 RepID=A0A419IB94_9PSEU|nr:hypothetical protein D5S19_02100 [Amycolatopsis panacis]
MTGFGEDFSAVFRAEWARIVATIVGFCGDLHVAEDAAQEAFAVAAQRWPVDGVPDVPRAWLVTTARNRAIDRLRRERRLAEKLRRLDPPEEVTDMATTAFPDERLVCRRSQHRRRQRLPHSSPEDRALSRRRRAGVSLSFSTPMACGLTWAPAATEWRMPL